MDNQAQAIREMRKKTGLSQQAFGDMLGIPVRTIQNWETAYSSCPTYVVDLIDFYLTTKHLIQ